MDSAARSNVHDSNIKVYTASYNIIHTLEHFSIDVHDSD